MAPFLQFFIVEFTIRIFCKEFQAQSDRNLAVIFRTARTS